MTTPRALCIVIATGAFFGGGGGLIGYMLAVTLPAYYQTVYRNPKDPQFEVDAVQVGLGLGITQGLICGLIVGTVVVLAVALYESRRRDSESVAKT